jgi:hypothetical protein
MASIIANGRRQLRNSRCERRYGCGPAGLPICGIILTPTANDGNYVLAESNAGFAWLLPLAREGCS